MERVDTRHFDNPRNVRQECPKQALRAGVLKHEMRKP
jgi:hypothetical protein